MSKMSDEELWDFFSYLDEEPEETTSNDAKHNSIADPSDDELPPNRNDSIVDPIDDDLPPKRNDSIVDLVDDELPPNRNDPIDDPFDDGLPPKGQGSHRPDNDLYDTWIRQLCYNVHLLKQADIDDGLEWMSIGDYVAEDNLFLAIFLNPTLTRYFAPSFNAPSYKLRFPQRIYDLHDKLNNALGVMEADLEKAKGWYREAAQSHYSKIERQLEPFIQEVPEVYPDISSEDFAKHIVASQGYYFVELNRINRDKHTLSQSKAFAQNLHDHLHQHIKGQPEAIRTLVRNEINIGNGFRSKLRGLFTFVGPSGVGKTELAKQYALAISKLESTNYRSKIYHMEQYADEKSFFQLTGPGKQYTEAPHGELTQFVKFNPRSVIVFDEIEKAHKVAIQSLLTLLDSGKLTDNSTGEVTDFSQCVIIFTSNLGARELAASKNLGNVDLFDILSNSAYDQGNRELTLSPEFINRLRSGTGVRFKPLNALHFSEIAAQALSEYKAPRHNGITYKIHDRVAGVLALNALPEISARGIPQSLNDLVGRLATKLFQEPEVVDEIDEVKTVHLNLDSGFYDQWTEKQPICYIGGTQHNAEQFDQRLSDYDLVHVQSIEELHDGTLKLGSVDAFVIDPSGLDNVAIVEIMELLVPYNSKTPIIYIGEADYQNSIFDSIWKFIPHDKIHDTVPHLQQLLEVSWCIRHAERRNLKFEFSISYATGTRHVLYRVNSPRFKQMLGACRVKAGVPGLMQERPSITLADVIGLQRAKSQLQRILILLKHSERLKQDKIKIPSGIVLTGPPGTGKTMLARAVAGETRLRFLSLNVADLSSQIAGGATQKIKELFEAARDVAPAIIFIDEIDAIAGRRSQSGSMQAADHNKTVNTLLSYLDGLEEQAEPVFVIGATNNPELLDPAIIRPGRLDTPVICDLPDASARADFLNKFSQAYDVEFNDAQREAFVSLTMGLSGADMEKVFSECRIALALNHIEKDDTANDLKITVDMLRKAVATARFGTINDGPRLSEHARKVTAWHEAGHLVALKILTPDTVVPFATIEPRNQAQGFIVSQRNTQSGAATKSEIEAEIAIFMAGREGERMLGNDLEITSGASQDIKMATLQAARAVCELGLDDEVGQVNLRVLSEYGVADNSLQAQERIKAWLEHGQTTARRVLEENKAIFEHVASALFKYESIYADDIDNLFKANDNAKS